MHGLDVRCTSGLVPIAVSHRFSQTMSLCDSVGAEPCVKARSTMPVLVVPGGFTRPSSFARLAERFIDVDHALFLGRGTMFPIAMEGALKLKEISYIHAEGYPAGELKHGPLALVDERMPVVAVAPNDDVLEKLQSNLQEVRARGGELLVFADASLGLQPEAHVTVQNLPPVHRLLAPIVYVVPLQLLAYHVAVLRGTDVDQPRNLAKSVTVE